MERKQEDEIIDLKRWLKSYSNRTEKTPLPTNYQSQKTPGERYVLCLFLASWLEERRGDRRVAEGNCPLRASLAVFLVEFLVTATAVRLADERPDSLARGGDFVDADDTKVLAADFEGADELDSSEISDGVFDGVHVLGGLLEVIEDEPDHVGLDDVAIPVGVVVRHPPAAVSGDFAGVSHHLLDVLAKDSIRTVVLGFVF